ncbi:ribosomal protein S18 acetylase RimI-like enzyme [Saonia flava]|uniref:Ribosomal protein S18 acetylase RimI-like enzyme n=1 Tax=Saonia flava TaxID=523696 RepID=A0A846QXV3_9FLAO|nr:GNAT family N-acetyltransferase [Saonia flava]NJB71053.1 ribosomal protein S18 acetylase RimI-like enzyme [Saonia flava]
MISYRLAVKSDYLAIANLHAVSWQENYRGDFTDDFLDNQVMDERLGVWRERFATSKHNQHILIAEQGNKICGFLCAYMNDDPVYGTFIDNLHVSSKIKGKGIGSKLIKLIAQESFNDFPNAKLYLWVLESNTSAIDFYAILGGKNIETVTSTEIGDKPIRAHRIVWNNAKELLEK